MIFDGLDGRVARLMGTETAFGKEFDSLADMVAFGLAPAVVCYQWGVERIAEYGLAWWRFGWIAAFFYAAAVALRLARFNARSATQDKRYFEGLPSPSGAAIVAAFVALAHEYDVTGLPGLMLAFAITLLAALLMVSKFPYRSFKDRATGERVRYSKLLLVPLAIALIAIRPAGRAVRDVRHLRPVGPDRLELDEAAPQAARQCGGRGRLSLMQARQLAGPRGPGHHGATCRVPRRAGTRQPRREHAGRSRLGATLPPPCASAACAACARRARRRCSGPGTAARGSWSSGEAPGAEEDRQGEPFVGPRGMLLNSMLRAAGFERGEVYIANVLKCRPPHNRDPSDEEAERCLPYLRRQIELVAPAAILCVGRIAAQRLLGTDLALGALARPRARPRWRPGRS